jgi:histidyl-tRNA synthetase
MMVQDTRSARPKARVAKGFRDIAADEIRGTRAMLATIQRVYESYGFEPLEQPLVEYTDALGKFLPDQDRPNAGVFSFQDEEGDLSPNRPEQWLSLRYDLTAPLARYVAENQQFLPTPFRSYRQGWVFRNEKPGPGRFRQFMQFDADTVGSASPAADAEVCMMAADTMEALGIARGSYVMKVNNRKILDGVLESLELPTELLHSKKLVILRALDKFDRLTGAGVALLLTKGRKDESGDFTPGAGLSDKQASLLISFLSAGEPTKIDTNPAETDGFKPNISVESKNYDEDFDDYVPEFYLNSLGKIQQLRLLLPNNAAFQEGLDELEQMVKLFSASNYGDDRISFDPSVVRGLEYYTGPVFECELLMETKDEKGNPVRFGSVGGGGRYDDLVSRFTGQKVPSTGFSIGVSRLYSALKLAGIAQSTDELAPVVVLVMDKERQGDYWSMVQKLRGAGIRAEMYVGTSNFSKQMKYADKRGAPVVIIQGGDEKAKGEIQIKDLRLGSQLASEVSSREEYASQRLAQVSVLEADMVETVKKMLAV